MRLGRCILRFTACMVVAILLPVSVSCETSRQDLAKIRVGKDGNFKYWQEDSPAIVRLKAFVAQVTDPASKDFVPACDRIATFDVDGTLLCETAPTYFNFMLFCYRMMHDPTYTPDPEDRAFAKEIEEYVLSNHSLSPEWGFRQQEIQSKAFYGMTNEEFDAWVQNYIENEPVVGLTNLKWGTALYWPMIEVVSYLVANDFKVFICSGVDREMGRVLCKDIYDIPPYQFIASDVDYVLASQSANDERTERKIAEGYPYTPGERVERGEFKQLTTAYNKIVSMVREIGQKPILAWGNSSGDYPMFYHATLDNKYPSIAFCLLCDDTVREFGNQAKADKCAAACGQNGWVAVSMRDEWKTIYGPNVKKE